MKPNPDSNRSAKRRGRRARVPTPATLRRAGVSCTVAAVLVVLAGVGGAAAADPAATKGFYQRLDDRDELAQPSGQLEYLRFFDALRVIRLYIPLPYAETVSASAVRRVFDAVDASTTGSAYLRGNFGVLEADAIAHVDRLKLIDDRYLFDCGKSAPCEIRFDTDEITVVNPGLVRNLEFRYQLVPDHSD